MHVHANPINLNAQLDALSSAQKAAAKREASRTRKKLSEFASELAGEAGEACVVSLEGRENSQEDANRQNQPGSRKNPKERSATEDTEKSISDWA